MKLFFVGVACTEEIIKYCNQKYYSGQAKVRPQQTFDYNLLVGLSKYSNIYALTEPPVESYPRSECLFFNKKKEAISDKLSIVYMRIINLFGIKTIFMIIDIFFASLRFCLKNKKNKSAILVGNLTFYTLLPTIIIAKIFKTKVYTIVPDIPQYVLSYSNKNSYFKKMTMKIINKINYFTIKGIDGFIFLTIHMNELLNTKKKPFMVMEGFVNNSDIMSADCKIEIDKKVIMYAGTLHEKFGIKNLIEAFKIANLDNCELWICGEGDYLNTIIDECRQNINIKYKGVKSRKEIIQLEKSVTLLINTRPTFEEYTKYSFPSKTLEYMASGTPLLSTKLAGISDEYYDYIYFFESEKIDEMAERIKEVISIPSFELYEFGLRAQKFVLEHKNNIVQASRIYDFIVND